MFFSQCDISVKKENKGKKIKETAELLKKCFLFFFNITAISSPHPQHPDPHESPYWCLYKSRGKCSVHPDQTVSDKACLSECLEYIRVNLCKLYRFWLACLPPSLTVAAMIRNDPCMTPIFIRNISRIDPDDYRNDSENVHFV